METLTFLWDEKSARGTSSTEGWRPVVLFLWLLRPHQWPTCHPIWLAFCLIKAFVAPQTGCITISAPYSPVFMVTWHYKQRLKEIRQFLCASPYGQRKSSQARWQETKQHNQQSKLKTLNLHRANAINVTDSMKTQFIIILHHDFNELYECWHFLCTQCNQK